MADSIGSGFPTTNLNKGHLFFDMDENSLWEYVGGPPIQASSWKLLNGVFEDIPNSIGQWGERQSGALWWSVVQNTVLTWDGAQVVPIGSGGGGGDIEVLNNGVLVGQFSTINVVNGTNTTAVVTDLGGGVAEVRVNASGGSGLSPVVLANIDGITVSNVPGTYTRVGTVLTCTVPGNTLQVGHLIRFDATSGAAADGNFEVTSIITPGLVFTCTHGTSGDTSGNMQLVEAPVVGSTALGVANVARLATGQYAINFSTGRSGTGYVIVLGFTGASDIATTGGNVHYYLRQTMHVRIGGTQSDGMNANVFSISVVIYDIG